MPKTRLTAADVAAEVAFLRATQLGKRCANVYDLNPRTYLFKLNASGGGDDAAEGSKTTLLLESGVRFHTTRFVRDKAATPSNITLKLRMHLRTRRLTDVRQLGADRIVVFTFGSGAAAHHLILELYAGGNIILTDQSYTVLTLLRSHRDDAGGLVIQPRAPYPLAAGRPFTRVARAEVVAALTQPAAAQGEGGGGAALEKGEAPPAGGAASPGAATAGAAAGAQPFPPGTSKRAARRAAALAGGSGGGGGGSGSGSGSGKLASSLLSSLLPHYGSSLVDHALATAGVGAGARCPLERADAERLAASVEVLQDWLASTISAGAVSRGYVTRAAAAAAPPPASPPASASSSAASATAIAPPASSQLPPPSSQPPPPPLLLDVSPFPPPPGPASASVSVETYPDYDAALDAYFSAADVGRAQGARAAAERAALSKVDRMRADQAARAGALEAAAAEEEAKGVLLEANADAADAAISAVNDALGAGTPWPALTKLIRDEAEGGNPVAGMIHSMDLAKGEITLVLSNEDDGDAGEAGEARVDENEEEDSEEDEAHPRNMERAAPSAAATRAATLVRVRLALSARANAAAFHASRKKAAAKADKTIAAAAATLAAAERKAAASFASIAASAAAAAGGRGGGGGGGGVAAARSVSWFEKFLWFVTSENALCVTARDPPQAGPLLSRYARRGDALVGCGAAGAPLVLVKRPRAMAAGEEEHTARSTADQRPPLSTPSSASQPSSSFPPFPALSLAEAAAWAACRSSAWADKARAPGWWAPFEDASPTGATPVATPGAAAAAAVREGPQLPQGWALAPSRRRPLPPSQLVLGIALLFRVEGRCAGAHAGERRVRSGEEAAAAAADAADAEEADAAEEEEKEEEGAEKEEEGEDEEAGGAEEAEEAASAAGQERRGGGEADTAAVAASDVARTEAAEAEKEEEAEEGEEEEEAEADAAAPAAPPLAPAAPPRRHPPPPPPASSSAPAPGGGGGGGVGGGGGQQKPKKKLSATAKKAAAKYADQDEEDRALALALLGSVGRSRKAAAAEAAAAKAAGERAEKARRAEAVAARAAAKAAAGAAAAASRAAGGGGGGIGGGGGGGRAARRGAASSASAAADAAAADDDGVPLAPGATRHAPTDFDPDAALTELSLLTGCPAEADAILWAVPIVAPYSAVASYSLKAKVTPATGRKGKAAKAALDAFARAISSAPPHARAAARAAPEAEALAALPTGCKVSLASLGKLGPAIKKLGPKKGQQKPDKKKG